LPRADCLVAEVEGEKDAVAEENAPQTPAAEGEDGSWGAADAPAPEAAETPAEPEEVQKSLDDYLAERAAISLAAFGKKEARQVTAETLEGQAFRREAMDEFFAGKVSSYSGVAHLHRLTSFSGEDHGQSQGAQEGEGFHRG
jgi:plasminogen activator inhibitor 1 RNA-binding protein